jgi:hypothetical protein
LLLDHHISGCSPIRTGATLLNIAKNLFIRQVQIIFVDYFLTKQPKYTTFWTSGRYVYHSQTDFVEYKRNQGRQQEYGYIHRLHRQLSWTCCNKKGNESRTIRAEKEGPSYFVCIFMSREGHFFLQRYDVTSEFVFMFISQERCLF